MSRVKNTKDRGTVRLPRGGGLVSLRVLQGRRGQVQVLGPHFGRSAVGYSQCEMVETDVAFVEPVGAGVGMFDEPDRTESGVVVGGLRVESSPTGAVTRPPHACRARPAGGVQRSDSSVDLGRAPT